jgi:hypothetical protein
MLDAADVQARTCLVVSSGLGMQSNSPGGFVAPLPYAECLPLSDFSEARMMMMEGHAVARVRKKGPQRMAAAEQDGRPVARVRDRGPR